MWPYKLFIKRFNAFLVDFFIAYIVIALVQSLILLPLRTSTAGITSQWFSDGWNVQLYTFITISLPSWLYFSILDSGGRRGTLGKRLLGVQVLLHDESKLPFSRAFARTILKLLPLEILYLSLNLPTPLYFTTSFDFRWGFGVAAGVGFIYLYVLANTKGRECQYDRWLKTKVIDLKPHR